MAKAKSWREKLADSKGLPKVERITGKMSARWGRGTVAIPAPREIDELMRRVPEGRVVTIDALRAAIARRHGADVGCPITTGIFAWIAAHAAEEGRAAGERAVTPYWRTLKAGGEVNPKYPGGIESQRELLADEGHVVVQRGKRFFVLDHEAKLARPRVRAKARR
jgi:alkylated DNA nucleotide flippase Atl1